MDGVLLKFKVLPNRFLYCHIITTATANKPINKLAATTPPAIAPPFGVVAVPVVIPVPVT